ncbi:MAG: polysaccharide deacetylase family protein [Clostridia bacterium]|nr:polysaccharide deacetylase family protein [Clostridia bacterium]MBQ4323190.1 polysaccharide deacetylase family protein [Clostridia bacterium]
MFQGKMKAITFSYDDGVTQDIRLAELFHKYGMKATFNLNYNKLGQVKTLARENWSVNHSKNAPADVPHIYAGHEIAGHTLDHPRLPDIADDAEVIRQVEEDRLRLSEIAGYEVIGFAYPCGGVNNDDRVAELIRNNTGARYCRTIKSNHSFDLQENLYRFNPTVYHYSEMDKMFELGEQFLALKADKPQIFYVWGHAYEFDINNNWDRFEEFLQMMSGKDDIFYGTNKEVLL